MTSSLAALHDHRVHSGLRRSRGFPDRTDLNEHLHAGAMRGFDERRGISPEKDEHRDAEFDHLRDLTAPEIPDLIRVVRARERRDNDVAPKGPIRELASAADTPLDLLDRKAEAQDPESTRLGDRRGELGHRGGREPDIQDRMLDLEQVTERRAQAHRREVCRELRNRADTAVVPICEVFERLTNEDFAYLTTTGRRSGRAHTVEIWFAFRDGRVYLLSGGGDRADWVRNLRKDPTVRVRIGTRSTSAKARVLRAGTPEDQLARQLLDGKYQGWRDGKRLSGWARTALPVAIDVA
jgi:deazaflavin-dependent oxidoreductase (nitroreductase family)